MRGSYNSSKTYEMRFEVSIEDFIKLMDKANEEKNLGKISQVMLQGLHDLVCSQRMSREEIIKIKEFAAKNQLEFLKNDCDARIRNLSAN